MLIDARKQGVTAHLNETCLGQWALTHTHAYAPRWGIAGEALVPLRQM